MDDTEEPLGGGDVTEGVVRVGDTVRRPVGPHSPTVHWVLEHLEQVGFEGAPRFQGVDEQGREILTYVPGEVAGRPWPAWVADEDRGLSVARLLRRLDDCLIDLGLPDDAPHLDHVGPAPTFLGHRDITPENTIFRDGEAVALIDFDLIRPASRVDEVVNLLLWWGAWMPVEDREPVMRSIDAAERGRLLVDAYGLGAEDRAFVVPVAIDAARRSWFSMRERAERLGGGWARMWREGVGDRIVRRQRWLDANAERLSAAMR